MPLSDNNLINGRNPYDCSKRAPGDTTPCVNNTPHSIFKLTAGKKHRLRLINAGAESVTKFSLDGHNMTVIANDFVPIQPYDTKGLLNQCSRIFSLTNNLKLLLLGSVNVSMSLCKEFKGQQGHTLFDQQWPEMDVPLPLDQKQKQLVTIQSQL